MEKNDYDIALLIDGDNASYKTVEDVISKLSLLGRVLYKRVYGNFSSPSGSAWKETINKYSLTPVQQFAYTTGKNATDSKMIIDAMDILYSGKVNAYCLMTSDSDFTGIANRLKENGIFVIGAGKDNTPASFVNACDRYFLLKEKQARKQTRNKENKHVNTELEDFIDMTKSILSNTDDNEMYLANLINVIYRSMPEFSSTKFGYKKPVDLFKSLSKDFVVKHNEKTGADVISLK